jgi:hypothetical protein
MLLFIGMSFEFIIRGDNFFGAVLIFTGVLNLFAFQKAPKRVSRITIFLNIYNALLAITVAYNYSSINYSVLFYIWFIISLLYIGSSFRQLYSILSNKKFRRKQKKRIS